MEPFPVTLNPHQALHTELLALIPDPTATPAPGGPPELYEIVTRDGRLGLKLLAGIPADWWTADGVTGVLDALTARITGNPWRYTTLLGYALHLPDRRRAFAADRAGTVHSVTYDLLDQGGRARSARSSNPARLVPEARSLRRAALAINGPALPSPRTPIGPLGGSDEAAGCVLVDGPDDLAAALTDMANEAGIAFHRHRPATVDVTTWRAAQLLLVLATPRALRLTVRMPHRPGLVLLDPDREASAPNPGLARDARALGAEQVTAWPQGGRWLRTRITAAANAARDAVRAVGVDVRGRR